MNDFREYSDYLMHYGRKGMKWGENRFEAIEPSKGRKPSKGGDDTSDNGNNSGGFLNRLQNNFGDLASRVEQHANEATEVGNKMSQEINAGNYGTAYDIYKNASPEARSIIDAYIRDTAIMPMIRAGLGNGDVELGRKRIETGKRIAEVLFDNEAARYLRAGFLNLGNKITGNNVRINSNIDIHRIPGKRING